MKVGESSTFRLVCLRLVGILYYTMCPIDHTIFVAMLCLWYGLPQDSYDLLNNIRQGWLTGNDAV